MNLIVLFLAAYAAAVVTALWAGLGVCTRCGRMCPPWTDRCWKHHDNP